MNFNEKITIFRTATDPNPGCEVPIWWFFASVQQGEFKNEIEAIRAAADPETKTKLKKTLPAATISGTFKRRSAAELIKHSGFICLDFDGKENPNVTDWPAARNIIGSITEVAFCALSASGKGCFAVIPLAYPEQHKSQFEALKRDFLTLGYVIDQSCSDVSRLRFLSCDFEAIINQGVKTYHRIYTPKPIIIPKVGFTKSQDDKIYSDARNWLDKRETFLNGNRNHYITELAGYLNRFGVSESFTRLKCLEFEQIDFPAKEIEAIVKWAYNGTTWTNKVNIR